MVVFNYVFFIGFINLKKSEFRSRILANPVSFQETEQIIISENDLFQNKNGIEWLEHNKEICVNGDFFELIKIEDSGKDKILYVIKDKKENELFSAFFSEKSNPNEFIYHFLKITSGLDHTTYFNHHFYSQEMTQCVFLSLKNNFNSADFLSGLIKPPRVI